MSIQKFSINVTYTLGKKLLIADTLSRALLPMKADDLEFNNMTSTSYTPYHRTQAQRDLGKKPDKNWIFSPETLPFLTRSV